MMDLPGAAHSCFAGQSVSKRRRLGQDLAADLWVFSGPEEWPGPVQKAVP